MASEPHPLKKSRKLDEEEKEPTIHPEIYRDLIKEVPCGSLAHIPYEELIVAKTCKAMSELVDKYLGAGYILHLPQRHFPDAEGDYFYDCHCVLCDPDGFFLSEEGDCPGFHRSFDYFPTEADVEHEIWHCAKCIAEAQEDGGICAFCHKVLVGGDCMSEPVFIDEEEEDEEV